MFNGGAYMQMEDDPCYYRLIEDDNEITVSMWVYIDSNFANADMFNDPCTGFQLADGSQQLFRFDDSDDNGEVTMTFQDDAGLGAGGDIDSSSVEIETLDDIPVGEWHHIATVVDTDAIRLEFYLDGVRGPIDEAPTMVDFLAGFGIIDLRFSSNDYHGKIDTVHIFDRALSHGEIVTLADKASVVQPITTDADINEDGTVDFVDVARISIIWADEPILWPTP
jgi:hypothetical protein